MLQKLVPRRLRFQDPVSVSTALTRFVAAVLLSWCLSTVCTFGCLLGQVLKVFPPPPPLETKDGGGRYWFFNHSLWDGLTVADLVFPWFVFLMGVSISLSLSSIMSRPFSWVSMLYKIFRRAAILFALGLVVNNCYVVEQCRVPGVLQR